MALSVLALSVLTFRPAAVAVGADRSGPQAAREFGPKKDEAFESGATAKFLDPGPARRGEKPDTAASFLFAGCWATPPGSASWSSPPTDGRHCHAVRMGQFVYGKSTQASSFETLLGTSAPFRAWSSRVTVGAALSSGSDATVRYWDIDKGQELRRFEGHSGIVYSAVLTGDDTRVMSCGQDNTLRSWDAATGRQLQLLEVNNSPIRCVAVSHDDRLALSGGDDGIGRVGILIRARNCTGWRGTPDRSGTWRCRPMASWD